MNNTYCGKSRKFSAKIFLVVSPLPPDEHKPSDGDIRYCHDMWKLYVQFVYICSYKIDMYTYDIFEVIAPGHCKSLANKIKHSSKQMSYPPPAGEFDVRNWKFQFEGYA